MGLCVNHWTKHVKSSVDIARKGIQYGLEEGDIQFACYNHFGLLNAMVFQGLPLDNVLEETDRAIRFVIKNKNTLSEYCFTSIRQFALNLQGKTSGKYYFDEGSYDESKFLNKSKDLMMSLAYYFIYKLQSYYLFGDYKAAHEMSLNTREYIHQVSAFLTMVDYIFFYSLTLTALLEKASGNKSSDYWDALMANQDKLKSWSDHCPDNYLNMHHLVAAEIARINRNDLEAMDLYDRAIASAHEQGFVRNEAIANELAAKFWLEKGKADFAKVYMNKSIFCYSKWGAKRKVVDLEDKYPQLLIEPILADHIMGYQDGSRAKISATISLDVSAIVKASQAIFSETTLPTLLNRIMNLMIENAGAQRGSLVMEQEGKLQIVAAVEDGQLSTFEYQAVPVDSSEIVSPAIINYVRRTGDLLVLDDAACDERFEASRYIVEKHPKSILCLPMTNQGKLVGILYLENNLVTGAFVPDRVATLGMLAAQAAISLTNTLLLQSLNDEMAERKQAEERLQIATRAARIGIWDWDITRDELIWDDLMYAIYGIRREDFGGAYEAWLRTIHPDDKTLSEGEMQAALRGEREYTPEFRIIWPDGSIRHIKANSQTFFDNGKPVRMVGTNIDITESKQAAQRLRSSEERLFQAEKMSAIGKLAGGVAHDFNNQLAGILGYAELLMDDLMDEDLRSYAKNIMTAADRAANLTKQLLAFSRKGKYLTVTVDIHKIIAETVALLEHSIDKRTEIRKDLQANPHFVIGDPTQLQNAMLNLAVNARDAMPNGGELTFATSVVSLAADPAVPDLQPGRHVQILVSDTGSGMDDMVMKHLFEPFFTTKEKGTGLGLASVHGAIRNHHGSIRVESEVGKGTNIYVFLPLQEGVGTIQDEIDVKKEIIKGDARILVVDDEPIVCELTADILRKCGYKVTTCSNGEEAVEFYRPMWQNVDLVILDMVMPKMGGHEAFISMRKINPQIKALLSSGHSIDGRAQRILDEGALGFIQKPYTQVELLRKVAIALRHGV
jgi:PAS domain S-box-containing protein